MVSSVKNFEELPVCLQVKDVAAVLGVSRATAFNLTKVPGFPAIRISPGGKRIIIPKDKLQAWIENQAEKPLVSYK